MTDEQSIRAEARADVWIKEIEARLVEARSALNSAVETARRRRKAMASSRDLAKAVETLCHGASETRRHIERGDTPSSWWDDRLSWAPPEDRALLIDLERQALQRVIAVANDLLKAAPPSQAPLKRVK